jgi:DNA repair protein RadC
MVPPTPAGERSEPTALHLGNPAGGGATVVRNGGAARGPNGQRLFGSVPEARQSEGGSGNGADRVTSPGQSPRYWRYLQRLSDADALSAAEVLELLLHFGRSSHQAVNLSVQLLDRFGSLGAVVSADPVRLTEIMGGDGISVMLLKSVRAAVKAIVREPLEERLVIGSASALMDYLSVTMRHEPTETTRLLYLDRKNGLIKDEVQQRGTVDHTPLYPREVVKRVLELGACAVILVHNHPSGDPTPSRADIEITRQVAAALGTINVTLHDHVIVGRNKETSFRKLKLL